MNQPSEDKVLPQAVMSEDVARELRVKQAVEMTASTPGDIIGILFVLAVLVALLGTDVFTAYTAVPQLILLILIGLQLKSFLRLRNAPRPRDISPRRIRLVEMIALLNGLCWGFMYIAIQLSADKVSQAVVVVGAFSLVIGLSGISSPRIVRFFSIPVLLLSYLSMLWSGNWHWLVLTLMFGGTFYTVWTFPLRARKKSIAAIEQSLKATQAMSDRFEAEEKLRRAELVAAKAEHERQIEANRMRRNLINAVAFPMILSHNRQALELTPAGRAQFKVSEAAIATLDFSTFFVDTSEQQRMYDLAETQGKVENYEIVMKDSEGAEFWTVISMQPLKYDGKDCWLSSIYVIDARKRMEQDLARAKDAAEQTLSELKTTQESLVHAEKMASLGQLTAGIAHEIKNPLNFVNNFSKLSVEMLTELAELLADPIATLNEEDRDDAEDLLATVAGNLQKIEEHGKRADSIVKNMLLHSRQGGGDKQSVSLNELTKEAMNLAYHGARASDSSFNVDLQTELDDDVGKVECFPQDLQRVILNLCSNGMYEAVKRSKNGGEPPALKVRTGKSELGFFVDIIDSGSGVPPEIRDKIFQPFFTTKPTGEGTGLGLSMSYDIVKQHGGELSLQSEVGQGATFRVQLPAAK